MRMSTGFVRAAGYDDKVRRVLFAITRDEKIKEEEVLRAAAEFNKKAFEEMQKRGIEKRDVVRITCEFDIIDGKIIWKWDTLEIEAYKETEEIGVKMSALMKQMEEEEKILNKTLEKLMEIAEKVKSLGKEIEDTIKELRRRKASVPSEG